MRESNIFSVCNVKLLCCLFGILDFGQVLLLHLKALEPHGVAFVASASVTKESIPTLS